MFINHGAHDTSMLNFKSVHPFRTGRGFFVVARVGLASTRPTPGSLTDIIALHIADCLQANGYEVKRKEEGVYYVYDTKGYVGSIKVEAKEMSRPSRLHYMVTEGYFVNINAKDSLRQQGFTRFVADVLHHYIYTH